MQTIILEKLAALPSEAAVENLAKPNSKNLPTPVAIPVLIPILKTNNAWTFSIFGDWKTVYDVQTVDSVQDFWKCFNHVPLPSVCEPGTFINYSFFKTDSKMSFEHPSNTGGGKWIFSIGSNISVKSKSLLGDPISTASLVFPHDYKEDTKALDSINEANVETTDCLSQKNDDGSTTFTNVLKRKLIDILWENLLLMLIGNTYNSTDLFTGVVLNVRPNGIHRLNLWSKQHNVQILQKQGAWIRQFLKLPKAIPIEFKLHEDTKQNESSIGTSALLSA